MKVINKKATPLQIAYACNDKVFDGLYLSILSIVKRTKSAINFYLFSANLPAMDKHFVSLTNKHKNLIIKMIKKYNKKSTFTIIDCKKQFVKRCGDSKLRLIEWTPYTTFRLLFDMFPIKGKILYLDIDTMACGDIKKAFSVNMTNYELCVTRDIRSFNIRVRRKKYFNAGAILINLDFVRKTNLLKNAFDYLIRKKPRFCDQDALNLTSKYVLYREDDRFNRIRKIREENTIIKHFAGPVPKPWEDRFAEMYIKWNYLIWKEDIDEWKRMKFRLN